MLCSIVDQSDLPNKSGIVMASIGNVNRGIYLIIDVVDYKMWPKP